MMNLENMSSLEFNLYIELLSVAYQLYKDKTGGLVCGSKAEEIREKMFKAIKDSGLLD